MSSCVAKFHLPFFFNLSNMNQAETYYDDSPWKIKFSDYFLHHLGYITFSAYDSAYVNYTAVT